SWHPRPWSDGAPGRDWGPDRGENGLGDRLHRLVAVDVTERALALVVADERGGLLAVDAQALADDALVVVGAVALGLAAGHPPHQLLFRHVEEDRGVDLGAQAAQDLLERRRLLCVARVAVEEEAVRRIRGGE